LLLILIASNDYRYNIHIHHGSTSPDSGFQWTSRQFACGVVSARPLIRHEEASIAHTEQSIFYSTWRWWARAHSTASQDVNYDWWTSWIRRRGSDHESGEYEEINDAQSWWRARHASQQRERSGWGTNTCASTITRVRLMLPSHERGDADYRLGVVEVQSFQADNQWHLAE
jgi:hypothetical protein